MEKAKNTKLERLEPRAFGVSERNPLGATPLGATPLGPRAFGVSERNLKAFGVSERDPLARPARFRMDEKRCFVYLPCILSKKSNFFLIFCYHRNRCREKL
jgi:hypothetical protein